MVIKESSDGPKSPVMTTGVGIARPVSARSLKDYLALAIATCGVGYLPLAPGTWGSAVGVGIYLMFQLVVVGWFTRSGWKELSGPIQLGFRTLLLVVTLIISLIGVWAATRVERLQGQKDPSKVVVDEVAGQLITFLFIPFISPWWVIVTGFFLFRAFDIWKPYPIRRLESLESGLGIMADDVLAGIYAATVLAVVSLLNVVWSNYYA